MDAGYFIKFSNTYRLDMATGYMDHWVKKAIDVLLYLNNFSREGGFLLSQAWQPVNSLLKQARELSNGNESQAQQYQASLTNPIP
jgi:hypothetical protein